MRHAFSLVELSIVLVILGLITGGILAGQSLIRAAELRSVTTEAEKYESAGLAFIEKYRALPGDMDDATRYWGRLVNAAHCVTNSGAVVNTATGTCDGSGNGSMDYPAAASQSGEVFQFWRQLALAGLIEGSYTGLASAGSQADSTIGTNVPKAKVGLAGWRVATMRNYAGDTASYELDYGHNIIVGAPIAGTTPYGPLLTPEEAWNIDAKADDGKPASGRIIALYWDGTCAAADDGSNADTDYAASYRVSDKTARCAFYFRNLFE